MRLGSEAELRGFWIWMWRHMTYDMSHILHILRSYLLSNPGLMEDSKLLKALREAKPGWTQQARLQAMALKGGFATLAVLCGATSPCACFDLFALLLGLISCAAEACEGL